MKSTGFALLIAGFLLAAYSTALDAQHTHWLLFVPAALAAAAGVFAIKRAERGASRSEHVLAANRDELHDSLRNLVTQIGELRDAAKELATDQLRVEVDRRLRDDLRRFADARESLIHLFGVQTYANIMSEFAAGERYINRVWSASADGYRGEAINYLGRASRQFSLALQELESVLGQSGRSATT